MDEDIFMSQLLQELDHSLPSSSSLNSSAADLTPTKTPATSVKANRQTALSSENHDDYDLGSFLEGSESWDLDSDLLSPVKPSPKPATPIAMTPQYTPETCTRCVAQSVTEECVDSRWRKSIVARTEPGNETVNVYLYDDWYHTEIVTGDRFNVLGSLSSQLLRRSISVTSQSNLLILHPDILLTATALSNAPQCRRKPLLSSLVRSTNDLTPALLWGNMLHEVMQRCLQQNMWNDADIEQFVEEAIQSGLGQLVILGVNEVVAKREVLDRAKGLKSFKSRYLSHHPKADAMLSDTRTRRNEDPAFLAITDLLDIEEDIWSPTYGLKGKLDATVQCIISEPSISAPRNASNVASSEKGSTTNKPTLTTLPLPFELKTGRSMLGMEHRAQTMLYTLLVSERYGADVSAGLLFYTASEGGDVTRVPRGRNELRGLISARNELAAWMWKRIRRGKTSNDASMEVDIEDNSNVAQPTLLTPESEEKGTPFLPAPIDDERSCKRCYSLDTCMLFRKTHGSFFQQADPPIPDFLSDIYDLKTSHLTPAHTAFFRKWERLLSLEERDLVRFKRELWTMGAKERETKGRCFSGMVLAGAVTNFSTSQLTTSTADDDALEENVQAVSRSKIHRFTYRFKRSSSWAPPSPSRRARGNVITMLNGYLNVGDAITVSVEPNLLAFARGFIVDLQASEVVVGVDHKIDLGSIRSRTEHTKSPSSVLFGPEDDIIFRIDKDELFGGMAKMRNNLAQLLYAGGDSKRLELVVDLRPPVFVTPISSQPLPLHTAHLNSCQILALQHVLSAEDYALILGMPGTGKTTVIAQLIRVLVGQGKTVLLTSYTHSAVDNILMRLDDCDLAMRGEDKKAGEDSYGILRLGNLDKVHPDVRKYALDARTKATTVEAFERQLMSPPVVATTCLSIDNPLFAKRKFDYCIVDEASQITLPTCLGPLRLADKFVLVGDHFQLPPLVKNPEARQGGLEVSLFRLLSQKHPQAVVDLKYQYRMNEDIMLLSNRLIYDGRLQCGSEEVKQQTLVLPDKALLQRLHGSQALSRGPCQGGNCWIEKLVDERCRAVFVDTDALPAHDSRVGALVQNTVEAELIRQLTLTLLHSGVSQSQIGIITLYRQQVKLLSHLLLPSYPALEILTADKSQGRDKDCVLISLVRSNDEGNVGDLVKDWRRMNVSFTRAKKKLVIIGSRKTLMQDSLLNEFFGLMDEKGWVLRLPKDADLLHDAVFGRVEGLDTGRRRKREEESRQEEQQDIIICDELLQDSKPTSSVDSLNSQSSSDSDVEIVQHIPRTSLPSGKPPSDPDSDVEIVDHKPAPPQTSDKNKAPSLPHKPSAPSLKGKENSKIHPFFSQFGKTAMGKAKPSSSTTAGPSRPAKKAKLAKVEKKDASKGILKGRPILQDLVANEW